MCGIVGYVSTRVEPGLDAAYLERACRTLRHRGPDGEGIRVEGAVGLGHRRLSIIDLAGGTQPMSYGNGRWWITFNGEIYNYRELRTELAGRGHTFRTTSDTEVILAAFAEWGRDVPTHLRGIFAFGIWDQQERSLFLARDHLGVKPLLHAERGDRLVFASELKAILEADGIAHEADPEAVSDYLALGYVLGTKTIVRGVSKLEPGTWLVWRAGRTTSHRYWDLAALANVPPPRLRREDEPRLVEEYASLLENAVAAQMVSDVPVGAFLSGGVDSSSIVHHMRSHTGHRPKTFSMGFAEPSFSELEHAARVAEAFGTEHHAETVHPELEATLPDLVRRFDEPLGDTSIVPTHFVSRLASRHVKVVLSGDGGDEGLAGYDTYVADWLQGLYQRVPEPIHRHLLLPASRWIPASGAKVGLDYKIRQFVAQAHAGIERAHYGWRLLFDPPERTALLGGHDGYDPFATYARYFARVPGGSTLNRCLYVDANTWLSDDILVKVDRASMAVGLEVRVPFLDVDLFEFCMRLPERMKIRGTRRKIVLKRAMRGHLPDTALSRRKSGFNAPVSAWLRGPLRGMAEELVTTPSALVDVEHPALADLWRAHLRGSADHGFRLWALVVLLLWERGVLRGGTPARQADAAPQARARVACGGERPT